MVSLRWSKKLTKSDAQQKTTGSKMPFLRFTKGYSRHDHMTWFRNEFFDTLNWQPDRSKQGLLGEKARVRLRVTLLGTDLGVRSMRLDHIPDRAMNHKAPTTHLHYDTQTRHALEARDLSGHKVVVTRDDADRYNLEVL